MEEKIKEILLNNFKDGNWQTAQKQLLDLFNNTKKSFSIVRWYDNVYDDIVCKDEQIANKYIKKYNELSGKEKCYIDKDIWLPLND